MKEMNTGVYVPAVDFKEQTPTMQIGTIPYAELYKKAWLENDNGVSCEYCQNTTTWD